MKVRKFNTANTEDPNLILSRTSYVQFPLSETNFPTIFHNIISNLLHQNLIRISCLFHVISYKARDELFYCIFVPVFVCGPDNFRTHRLASTKMFMKSTPVETTHTIHIIIQHNYPFNQQRLSSLAIFRSRIRFVHTCPRDLKQL
jgi:hypothetical protein